MEPLIAGARELSVTLTDRHLAAFEACYRELLEWNQRFNLTAVTDREGVLVRHFLDSLSCLKVLPGILALGPDVVIVTGDHSTPAVWKAHSWHELPVLLWARYIRPDGVKQFGERPCMAGGLGHIHHVDLMPLAMAHAGRLTKFGA